jgi:hypothetical protein
MVGWYPSILGTYTAASQSGRSGGRRVASQWMPSKEAPSAGNSPGAQSNGW